MFKSFVKNFVKAISNPVTLVTAAAATALSGGTFTFAAFAMRAGTYAALSAGAQTLSPQPKIPEFGGFNAEAQGRTQMIKQPTASRRAVYGKVRVGGVLAHVESTNDDKFLHLVLMLASHEVEAIDTIYLNDEALTLSGNSVTAPSKFAGKVEVYKQLGSATQTANSTLVSRSGAGWSNSHRLQGIAYLYVRLEFDADAFPQGIPNISALVRGKKVYDPRTSTTAYSDNPALCLRDYLLDDTYGLGADTAEIDDTAITTAANICDESVALSGGGTEDRYTLNGTVNTDNAPKQIIEDMLASCGGVLTYSNGKFKLKAAKYVSPTVTLDETHLRGGVSLQTKRSRRDNYNAVKGIFTPEDTNYVAADYPAYISSTFKAEDNNETIFLDYDQPYTTSSPTAQRLAKIALFRNRQQVVMSYPVNLNGFQLDVGDTVQINNTKFGFSDKVFEVAEWNLVLDASNDNMALGVDLVLRELNSQVYDWNADEADFQLDNTNLPNPFLVPAVGLTLSDELQSFNQKALSVLIVDVSSGSVYANQFEVEAKLSTASTYVSLGISTGTRFELIDVQDGATYDVRARAINRLGIRGAYATGQHQIVGKTAPPSDVTNFSVNIVGNQAQLSWTPVTDLDLSHYRIRHAAATTGATYANATDLALKVSRPANSITLPAITGTYFIKAVDKLGLESVNPDTTIAIIDAIGQFNVVETLDEHPSFDGVKSGTAATGGELLLDTTAQFDDPTGDFDDATGDFDGGGGTVRTSGTYDFDDIVDLGAVYTSRVSSSITVTRRDYVNSFDDTQGLFDARQGDFDGDPQSFGTTNVELQIATTEDDPSGTPTYTAFRKFVVGDYKARAFKFRAVLTSTDAEATPVVTALSVSVDMSDKTLADDDIASGAGAKVITFTPAFRVLKGIGIAAQNLQSGDYYAITSKTASGFTITFYNSSNVAVDRTFDYVARGY